MSNFSIIDYANPIAIEVSRQLYRNIDFNLYDKEWITLTLSGGVMYLTPDKRNNPTIWRDYKLIFNLAMFNVYAPSTQKQIMTKEVERFEGMDFTKYRGNALLNNNRILTYPQIQQSQVKWNDLVSTVRNLNESGLIDLILVNSIPRGLEFNINTYVEIVDNRTIYFNGFITNFYYRQMVGDVDALTFLLIVRRAFFERVYYDLKEANRVSLAPRYMIKIYYHSSDKNNQEGVPFAVGPLYRIIEQIHTRLIMKDLKTMKLIIFGSDSQLNKTELILNVNDFQIQRIDVVGAGGCKDNNNTTPHETILDKVLRERVNKRLKGNSSGCVITSWGRLKEFRKVNKINSCFPQILADVIKNDVNYKGKQYRDYRALWKDLSPSTFKNDEPITTELAIEMSKELGYELCIYNGNGEIIEKSENADGCQTNRINICLNNGHYWLITFFSTVKVGTLESDILTKKGEREKACSETKNVYYDIETVFQNFVGCDNSLDPYMISFAIEDEDFEVVSAIEPSNEVCIGSLFNKIYEDIDKNKDEWFRKAQEKTISEQYYKSIRIDNLKDKISKLKEQTEKDEEKLNKLECQLLKLIKTVGDSNYNVTYRLIAYNGAKFDHYQVMKWLLAKGCKCISEPCSLSNISTMLFHLKTIKHKGSSNINIYISVWDPHLFVRGSLESVAQSFKLNVQKTHVDHDLIQEYYNRGEFKNYLTGENKNRLERYCKRDCEVLRELVKALKITVDKDYNYDIMKSPTVANMGYKLWQKTIEPVTGKTCKQLIKPLSNRLLDDCIRRNAYGGRTHCLIGLHKCKPGEYFNVYDVVSLYPYVMESNEYPMGEEESIKTLKQYKECIIKGQLCIIYCEIDMTNCNLALDGSSPYPLKVEGKPLDWNYKGKIKGYWSTIAMRRVINHGGSVSDPIYDEALKQYGITWNNKGKVFKEFISKTSGIKNEEDRNKLTDIKMYNPARREVGKIVMNSVSGKPMQRNFTQKHRIVTNESECRMTLKDKEEGYYESILGNLGYAIWDEPDAFNSPKPCYLTVFIYDYAKEYMDKIITSFYVYYSDTDSAFLKNDCHQKLEQLGYLANPEQKVLGQFDLEASGNILYVSSKKMYLLLDKQGDNDKPKIKKYGLKGVSSRDKFKDPENPSTLLTIGTKDDPNNNIIRFFEVLFKYKEVTVYTNQLKRSMVKGVNIKQTKLIKTIKYGDN